MSDSNDFTQVQTASVWAIKHCVCCVNPANQDDRMEFDDLVQLNAKLFELKEQVGRLTKAGDAMAKLLSCCGNPQSEVRGWNAAKGVQS